MMELELPGYWMNEASGVLAPVVLAYLKGEDLTLKGVVTMRAYFRQWVNKGDWRGDVGDLRTRLDTMTTRADVDDWLKAAEALGMDPL